jgi:hypothetical protein
MTPPNINLPVTLFSPHKKLVIHFPVPIWCHHNKMSLVLMHLLAKFHTHLFQYTSACIL